MTIKDADGNSVNVGGLKELVDVKYGVPSWKDFVATVAGAIVELPIMLMLWN